MKLITQRDMIRTLPDRYANTFQRDPSWYREDWGRGMGGSGKQIYERLLRLDLETCSVSDIANVASYLPGWLKVECDSCHQQVDTFVTLGADPYGETEYDTFYVCRSCIGALAALSDKSREEP